MESVLKIHDQGETSYSLYRGRLELEITKRHNDLNVCIIQLRDINYIHQHMYVKVSLLHSRSDTVYRTSVQELIYRDGMCSFNESFRFPMSSTSPTTRVYVSIYSANTLHHVVVGSMSFGIHKPTKIFAKGFHFILEDVLGKSKHMRVNEQMWMSDEENNYLNNAFHDGTHTTCNDIINTIILRDNLEYGKICEDTHQFANNMAEEEQRNERFTVRLVHKNNSYGFKLRGNKPTMICHVKPDSAADLMGLKMNDVIIRIGNYKVTALKCQQIVHMIRICDRDVTLTVERQHLTKSFYLL